MQHHCAPTRTPHPFRGVGCAVQQWEPELVSIGRHGSGSGRRLYSSTRFHRQPDVGRSSFNDGPVPSMLLIVRRWVAGASPIPMDTSRIMLEGKSRQVPV